MKHSIQILVLFFFFGSLIFSCQSDRKSSDRVSASDSDTHAHVHQEITDDYEITKEGIPIFYNMYLSVELTSLLENVGAVFTPEILNPVEKRIDYVHSAQKAMNLGVYAVNLSYIRVFEQYDRSRGYFNAMHRLSTELGIPDEYFQSTAERFEKNIQNRDSLIIIANEVYVTTDNYLKANERDNTASLIILGGWIEALYIASHLLEHNKTDIELMERIAEQSHSLNDLINLLSENEEDEVISKYLPELKALREKFENVKVDNQKLEESYQSLQNITHDIHKIRKNIVI